MAAYMQTKEVQQHTGTFLNWSLLNELRKLSLAESYDKANIFLVLIEYELNSLLGDSHLIDYISVHIRFDLERYLLIIS